MKFAISDPELFTKKVIQLFVATFILVPLVYYKLLVPATIYIILLLVLHLYFLYVYLSRIKWSHLRASRLGLTARLAGILFFAYILASLQFHGSLVAVTLNLTAALAVHILILLLLMARLEGKHA